MDSSYRATPHVAPRGAGTLRLTRRGRVVLFLFALFLAAGSALATKSAVAQESPEPIEVATVTVTPGETLWHHAKQVTNAGEDVRDVIATIQELNNLSDTQLRAGQQLLVPLAN